VPPVQDWQDFQVERIRVFEVEQRWAALEKKLAAIDTFDPETGAAEVPPEVAAEIDRLWQEEAGNLEPLLRIVMNEEARIALLKALAQPYLEAAQGILERARQAKARHERWKTIAERYLKLIGGRYRLPEASVYLQQREQVFIDDPKAAETIPDEWWRIERSLLNAEILEAHRKGLPIPAAVSVRKGDPYMVIRRARGRPGGEYG
jgi:hypothetical protein